MPARDEQVARQFLKVVAIRGGIELQNEERHFGYPPNFDEGQLRRVQAQRVELSRWAEQHLDFADRERWAVTHDGGAGRAAMSLHWMGEWATVLAWVLGITDAVPPPEGVGDFEELSRLFDVSKSPEGFLRAAHIVRSSDDLLGLHARLESELGSWLERYPLGGRAPRGDDGVYRSRAIERFRASEWTVAALGIVKG